LAVAITLLSITPRETVGPSDVQGFAQRAIRAPLPAQGRNGDRLDHSAEALIRWRHPQRGLLQPSEFIQVADECDPALLEIELTETAVMSDAEESVHILEAISRMGVLVSVDDFGTGYSSMSYLRRYPIDKLKIDRCYIEQMTVRPEDAFIVSAIISLAHSLRLKVIAEGVETPEQLQLLIELGCDLYQGFYYSQAVLPAKFEELVGEDLLLTEEDAARTHSKLAGLKR
jgi:EAL domain-containing protein (putative c-di-GMP-specific phosphodiesterase class I)